jgi:ubiquinone/menaquinone biosynthesis C-methylase UbiE
MLVLEPGCAMGYFTLPLARMVGPEGRVIAVDLQPKMLASLDRRARQAGLKDRIEIRRAGRAGLGIDDLEAAADLCVIIHMAHEVSDLDRFFKEVSRTLKPGGTALLMEPKWHVTEDEFELALAAAAASGMKRVESTRFQGDRKALFERNGE